MPRQRLARAPSPLDQVCQRLRSRSLGRRSAHALSARQLRFETYESRTMFAGGTIAGTVFIDANGNGSHSAPQSGVNVDLYLDTGDKVYTPNTDTLIQSPQTTDVNGKYSFTNLADGIYFVVEEVPTGYTQTSTPLVYSAEVLNGQTFFDPTNIDNFNDPNPVDASSIYNISGPNGTNPNPTLIMQSGTGIIGGIRNLAVDVLGPPDKTSAGGYVGTANGAGVFNFGSAGQAAGTEAILQYSGANEALSPGQILPITNQMALTAADGNDLTAEGASELRIDFSELQLPGGPLATIDVEVALTSPGGGTATYATTAQINGSAFTVAAPYASFTTNNAFAFSDVTSLQFTFNSAGVKNVDFLLNQIVTSVPSNVDRPLAFDFANFATTANLAITKIDSAGGSSVTNAVGNVVPGGPLTYTIDVTNNGPASVTGAAVTDTFPPQFTNATYTASVVLGTGSGFTASGSGAISDSVTLAANSTIEYVVKGTVSASAIMQFTNTAMVTPPNGTPIDAPDSDNPAVLTITKIDSAGGSSVTNAVGNVVPGGPLTYTIDVHNAGPGSVTGAAVADTFPPQFTNATYTASVVLGTGSGFTASGSGAIGDSVTLAANSTIEYVVTGTVLATATAQFTNTAMVTPPGGTKINAPDSDNPAVLTITKIDSAGGSSVTNAVGNVVPGAPLTYTIDVHNAGPGSVTGAAVADTFPPQFTNATYTASVVLGTGSGFTASGTGAIGDSVTLAANSTIEYVVKGTVLATATAQFTNTAMVTPPGGTKINAPDSDNPAVLTITKIDSAGGSSVTNAVGNVVPGAPLTYTIDVHNAGPGSVTGAAVADTFPPQFTNATYTASVVLGTGSGFTASGSGAIGDSVTLAANSTIEYVVKGTVLATATAQFTNTAMVTPPGGTTINAPDSDNPAVLTITKIDSAGGSSVTNAVGNVVPGAPLTYTIDVHNAGPGSVTGAAVADTFPPQFTNATYTASVVLGTGSGFTASGSGAIGDSVTLAANSTIEYVVTGTVLATATAQFTNTAMVTPPGGTTINAPDSDNPAVLTITKVDSAGGSSVTSAVGNVVPGAPLTYTIDVHNAGPGSVTGAAVADTFPPQFTNATYTASVVLGTGSGFTASGSGAIGDSVTLAANSTIEYVVKGTVLATATAQFTNTAMVTPPGGTKINAPDSDNPAVLTITKIDSAGGSSVTSAVGNVVPGAPLTYTIDVHNAGPGSVTGAAVADTFPPQFTNATYTASVVLGTGSGFTASGSGAIGDSVTLAANSTIEYVVKGTVLATATAQFTNTAMVTPPGGTKINAPDSDNPAVLTITKIDSAGGSSVTSAVGNVVSGTALTYTVDVHNAGPGSVTGAAVADTFPPQFTNATYTASVVLGTGSGFTASGSGAISDSVTLAANSTIEYVVKGTVLATATAQFTNTAMVTPPGGTKINAPDSDNPAHLTILKTASPTGNLIPGQSLTYSILVSNTGVGTATGAVVADMFPLNYTNPTYTTTITGNATDTNPTGSGNINDTVNLPGGATITYLVMGTVSANATGTLTNTASVDLLGTTQTSTVSNVITTGLGQLSGFVYVDANNNGVFDSGEAPIGGVIVTLTGTDNTGAAVSQTTVTNSNGAYSFQNLLPGTYKLSETQPMNFIDGKDTIGSQGPANQPNNDMFVNIPVVSGTNGINNNFGELGLMPAYVSKRQYLYPTEPVVLAAVNAASPTTASLTGFVFLESTAGSPAFNPTTPPSGESALSGVTVALKNSGGTTVAQATTDSNGLYTFAYIVPGTYSLVSLANTGNSDDTAIVGTQGGTAGTGTITGITLAAGIAGTGNDFGQLVNTVQVVAGENNQAGAAPATATSGSAAPSAATSSSAASAAPAVAVASSSIGAPTGSSGQLNASAVDAAMSDGDALPGTDQMAAALV